MYNHVNSVNGQESPLVNQEFYEFVCANAEKLDSAIIYDRDFDYDYFGFKVSDALLPHPSFSAEAFTAVQRLEDCRQ